MQRSERGLVAIGVAVADPASELFAGLAVSLPTIRYQARRLDNFVSVLRSVSARLERELAA